MAKREPLTGEELLGMALPPKSVGKMLTAKRVALGMSVGQVADLMHVHRRTVVAWERGQMDVNFARLLNWLMEGDSDATEMWRRRALMAEAALKDVNLALRNFQEVSRRQAGEFRERFGGVSRPGSSSTSSGKSTLAA